jgi:hypothetical protein
MPELPTLPIESLQHFKGIDFPEDIRFGQILVTGPPGAGKSTLIVRLGGWSEEGYLDLGRKHWWRSEILSVRPREIHLGLPFQGLANAVSVFDAEFLDRDPCRPSISIASSCRLASVISFRSTGIGAMCLNSCCHLPIWSLSAVSSGLATAPIRSMRN